MIWNVPEQPGIAGGGISLSSLPAANQGVSWGEVGQSQGGAPPQATCLRGLEAAAEEPGGRSPEGSGFGGCLRKGAGMAEGAGVGGEKGRSGEGLACLC